MSWANSAKSDMSWNSMSWNSQSWSDQSWSDQSWASMSWADMSWNSMSWTDMSWADMSWADSSQEDAAEGDTVDRHRRLPGRPRRHRGGCDRSVDSPSPWTGSTRWRRSASRPDRRCAAGCRRRQSARSARSCRRAGAQTQARARSGGPSLTSSPGRGIRGGRTQMGDGRLTTAAVTSKVNLCTAARAPARKETSE